MNEARSTVRPAVVVISSHVARGTVGNRAAVFALEILGFPVWAVPTVMLPWHPGHGPAPRIVPDAAEFSDFMAALAASPHLGEVGAINIMVRRETGRPPLAGMIQIFWPGDDGRFPWDPESTDDFKDQPRLDISWNKERA